MLGAGPPADALALLPWQANEVVAEVKRKQEKKEKKKKKREKRRLEALAAAAEEMENSVLEAEVRAGAAGGCLSGGGCGDPAVRGPAVPCPAGFVGALSPPKHSPGPTGEGSSLRGPGIRLLPGLGTGHLFTLGFPSGK